MKLKDCCINKEYIIEFQPGAVRTMLGKVYKQNSYFTKIYYKNNKWFTRGKSLNIQISEQSYTKIYSQEDYPEMFL